MTVASCAATCLGGDATVVTGKYDYSIGHGGTDSNFSHDIGTSEEYDMGPGGIPSSCGSPENDCYIEFYKLSGLRAFRLKFTFGCGDCAYKPV